MTYTDRKSLRERPGRVSFPDGVAPLFSDIPEGITISEYRRRRARSAPTGWRRLRVLAMAALG